MHRFVGTPGQIGDLARGGVDVGSCLIARYGHARDRSER
jgi:hypothetical protein